MSDKLNQLNDRPPMSYSSFEYGASSTSWKIPRVIPSMSQTRSCPTSTVIQVAGTRPASFVSLLCHARTHYTHSVFGFASILQSVRYSLSQQQKLFQTVAIIRRFIHKQSVYVNIHYPCRYNQYQSSDAAR